VASRTVTFAAPKVGHVFPPACDHVGRLTIADIGIPDSVLSGADHALWLLESSDAAAAFGPRPRDAHKGHFGHVLVVGGSVGKSGAAVLAARAALRSGAGLVTVATPDAVSATVAVGVPEAMTESLPSTVGGGIDRSALDRALALAEARDAAVIGPGLGTDESTWAFVREFVARCPVPLLVDADGLNALAAAGAGKSLAGGPGRPLVLTPHPGEMSRLTGRSVAEVQARRLDAASRLARETGAFVVLKGQRTLVAEPGGRVAVNPTGNPGMATGGAGDVLSGIGGALLARLGAWPAATAAVFVHGLAGDLAAAQKGEHSLIAGDVIDALPDAIRSLGAEASA
jgi:NAD(P)H-hydrate epimerase